MNRIKNRPPSIGLFLLGAAACWYIAGTITFNSTFNYDKQSSKISSPTEIETLERLGKHKVGVSISWAIFGAFSAYGMYRCAIYSSSPLSRDSTTVFVVVSLLLFAVFSGVVVGALASALPIWILRQLELPSSFTVKTASRTFLVGCFSATVASLISVPISMNLAAKFWRWPGK